MITLIIAIFLLVGSFLYTYWFMNRPRNQQIYLGFLIGLLNGATFVAYGSGFNFFIAILVLSLAGNAYANEIHGVTND